MHKRRIGWRGGAALAATLLLWTADTSVARDRPAAAARGWTSPATSGRSSRSTASPATAPTRRRARAGCGSTTATAALARKAIVPGKAGASELVARIDSADEPRADAAAEAKKPLSAAQKRLLRAWVEQGAAYAQHWAFVAAAAARRCRPSRTPAGPRNPIDAFVLARLEREGLRPVARGRPGDPDPPRHARPDRPAADARRGRRLPRRPVAGRLREGRRPAARLAALRRAHGAGTGSTRPATPTPTATTTTTTGRMWPWRDWVIDAFNAQPALRPLHRRAARRRPAARRRRWTRRSPPASTAITSTTPRAASSRRSTASSTSSTASTRRRRSSSA